MSIFQGSPLPSITTTQTAQQTAPQYYTDYLSDLAGFGRQQLGVPAAELVAPTSALQTQAFSTAPDVLGQTAAPLGAAQGALSSLAKEITPQDVSAFFNPYQSAVMDEMARRSATNVQESLLPQLKGAFAGQGAFGSRRYAGAMGQALSDVQSDLLGKQAALGMSGYQSALDAAMKQKGLMGSAAQIGGQLATQTGALGQNALNTLAQLGAQEQALGQARINAPMVQAQNIGQLMRGFAIPTGSTQTATRPGQQGEFGLSPLAQISSLGGLIGAAASPQSNLGWIGDLFRRITENVPTPTAQDFSTFYDQGSGQYPESGAEG